MSMMNRVLILVNHDIVIYNFRFELVERLIKEGYEVHVSCPVGEHTEDLIHAGVVFHEIVIERHSINPLNEIILIKEYKRLIREIDPLVILTYTVKPNIYGGIASKWEKKQSIANITGLGTLESKGIGRGLLLTLYRIGMKGARKIYFQNESNKQFFIDRKITNTPMEVIPGSGVNLSVHTPEPYPESDENMIFSYLGRIMRDKGIDELIEAISYLKKKHSNISFRLIGFFDGDYEDKIKKAENQGLIEYIGFERDIHSWIAASHAIIQPSYHEGMSNVILEAAATARPIIASDIPGCREGFDEGVSGIGFSPRNSNDLVRAVEDFIALPHEQKAAMGRAGRKKMEREFDRQIIVNKYLAEIRSIKPVVLILVNHEIVIYNFRLELVEKLLSEGYDVHLSSPPGQRIEELKALGVKCHIIKIERHGVNPLSDLRILREYKSLIKEIRPLIVFSYTVKPNVYGAIVASYAHVPIVANITGLGTALENGGWGQKLLVMLYKYAFRHVQRVFFQNDENMSFFRKRGIAVSKYALLPGSGVNLKRFSYTELHLCGNGSNGESIKFAFISRIMEEKGIEQYLEAAETILRKHPKTEFHICGFCEQEYEERFEYLMSRSNAVYHGMIKDVSAFMAEMHCVVHPTYYPEGLSNVLLEAGACGRAIITTDRSGCREVCDDGINGFLVKERNTEDLVEKIEKFILLPFDEKRKMGIAGRTKVEKEFDRDRVVNAYMKELEVACG